MALNDVPRLARLLGLAIKALQAIARNPLTFRLLLKPSYANGQAQVNFPNGGSHPALRGDGDVWRFGDILYFRKAGVDHFVYDSAVMTAPTQAEAEAGTATTWRVWPSLSIAQAIKYQARPPLIVSLSDLTTSLTTGVKEVIRIPEGMTIDWVRLFLKDASTAGVVEVNITVNAASIFTTRPTIDQDEKTSTTAATPAVLTSAAVAAGNDQEMIFEVTQAGANAKGLKAIVYWKRA